MGRTYSLASVRVCPSASKNWSSGWSKNAMTAQAITARMTDPMIETVKYSLDLRVCASPFPESC